MQGYDGIGRRFAAVPAGNAPEPAYGDFVAIAGVIIAGVTVGVAVAVPGLVVVVIVIADRRLVACPRTFPFSVHFVVPGAVTGRFRTVIATRTQ